ncbi:N-terminal nucleophile aminohydrolase [Fomitopsis serialis]|uniref:N-terminal nucleophile aminohydrolase n=1 Tax=Fomitopsis serialis TaxID=139415 RepID=UPI0020085F7A|nr:N-terminal nucleophile aminohydrolase [Neoantrodia serialis]KAH9922621.1 N-terminal nucleophile aminohydrolase [Neoantrodia serialis]
MCRWFTYISTTEPCLLEDVLIVPKHSLAKQVHDRYLPHLAEYEPDLTKAATKAESNLRNSPYNMDGLGVGWYSKARADYGECDGPHPALYKVLRLPTTDPIFASICANTSTHCVFAHIRAASGSTAITESNCHPFQFGRWLFMHNGSVAHFAEARRELSLELSDEASAQVKGTTDSETLAALFFTFLERSGGAKAWETSQPLTVVKAALEQAIAKVIEVQKRVMAKQGKGIDASSLNLAVTDGTQLLAIRFRNHATEHPPSLYYSTKAGVTLNRKYPDHPDEGVDRDGAKPESEHGSM